MTIDEAIMVLEKWAEAGERLDLPKTTPAMKLGIEALKAVRWIRGHKILPSDKLMPGETEE